MHIIILIGLALLALWLLIKVWVWLISSIFDPIINYFERKTENSRPDNEFIQAHLRLKKLKREEKRMNDELNRMRTEKKDRRKKQHPEYLEWCRKNREFPKFPDDNSLNYVIG